MRPSPLARSALALLLALLVTGPLAAYTIVLKDGSSIQAREKYRIEGQRAIITLFNGSQTFVLASQIDAKKTDEANHNDYGKAQVLPGERTEVPSTGTEEPKERTFKDLLASRGPLRDLPQNRRPRPDGTQAQTGPTKTSSGAIDLTTWPRRPYAGIDVATEIKRLLATHGITEVEVYEGTKPDHPFLEVRANSEGMVFKVLAGATLAVPEVQKAFPKVSALELLLMTNERTRAGQFLLTPQMATDLTSKKVDLASFFIENVQF